jgi:hypothetical protein
VGGASEVAVVASLVVAGAVMGVLGLDSLSLSPSLELDESPMMACCCDEDGKMKKVRRRK